MFRVLLSGFMSEFSKYGAAPSSQVQLDLAAHVSFPAYDI